MDIHPKPSGVDGLGDLSLGTHFCVFYETEQDLLAILAFYFKPGLAKHEYCLWLAHDDSNQEARNALRQVIPSADQHLEAGDIEIVSCQQFYCPDDVFDAAKILQRFHLKIAEALAKGYARVRVFGDEAWLEKENWKDFYDYEVKIDESLNGKPVSILCAYPNANFSAADIFDIALTHDFIATKRNGTWQLLESSKLKQVKADTERDIRELDQRVTGLTGTQRGAAQTLRQAGEALEIRNQLLQAEIIEGKRREEALQESEERFSKAFHANLVPTTIARFSDGRFVDVNQAFLDLTGYQRDAVIGQSALDLHLYVDPEVRAGLMRKLSDGETVRGAEARYRTKEGKILDGLVSMELIEVANEPCLLNIVLDITERKRAEEALRKSERVLREAEELGHTGSWDQDLVTGDIFNTDENLRLFFGDNCSKGVSFADYTQAVHPEDREFVLRRNRQLITEGGPGDIEFRVVWPDGSVHVLFGRANVVRDESGQAVRIYGTNLDITERKRAEESLRESQQLLRLVLATLPVGVMVIDRDGDIILVNEAWKRIWGGAIVSGRERWAQIKGFWHASGERIAPADWASMRALSAGQTSLNELIDIETYDDQRKTIHNSVAPIRNPEERIVGAVMVNEDVTERVRAEEETIRQSAHAEALARIAARLNRQLDLDTVVHAVCQEVVDTFKASQATMTLYDKESDLLAYTGGVNIPPEYAATIEPTARTKFNELLRAMGPIMVIPDIQSMPDAPNAEFNSHFDVRTVVTAAMLRDDELIGVVALGVNGHIREFSIDELTLLKAISDQAAQALANAQLLKAAEKQHEQLRALSIRLVETQETERRAIARELHDDIGQTLTGLMMQLGTAKSRLPKSAKSVHSTLEQSEALIQEILDHTRSIITDLRPQVLDDLGLVPALQRLGDDFQENTGVKVEMNLARLPKRLPSRLEDSLFRIVQEALTNVRKHAKANHVSITLEREKELVVLSVQDDGLGFEKQITRSRANGEMVIEGGWLIPAGHFGLIGIQERAAQLGGTLQVISAPGRGTTLRVELPLSEETVGSDERP